MKAKTKGGPTREQCTDEQWEAFSHLCRVIIAAKQSLTEPRT